MIGNRPCFKVTTAAIVLHSLLFLLTAVWMRYGSHPDLGAASWSFRIYYDYATQALEGQLPYRDFLVEYPILSFPLFLVPRLLVSDFADYRIVFGVEMFLFDVTALLLLAHHIAHRGDPRLLAGRLGWYTAYCTSISPLVVGRFELAPMVLGFAAAVWWFSGRNTLGGITAGLGALMKVFPGLVAGPGLMWEVPRYRVSQCRGSLAFAITVGLGVVSWFCVGGPNTLNCLRYHAERGLQIESIYAGLLLAFGKLREIDVPWMIDHKAIHIVPEWGSHLAVLAFPVQVAAILIVLVQFWRSDRTEGIRYSGAAILASLVTSKVLSPQYLVWVFPFVAAMGGWTGSRARWLFLFSCLITALIYPGPGFMKLLDHQLMAILVLNLRNLLLVSILALLLFGPAESMSACSLREPRSAPGSTLPCGRPKLN